MEITSPQPKEIIEEQLNSETKINEFQLNDENSIEYLDNNNTILDTQYGLLAQKDQTPEKTSSASNDENLTATFN